MRVFFDNCTSQVLATTLDGYIRHDGHSAYHIKDIPGLPRGRHSSDEEWLTLLGEAPEVWMFITGDGRLLKNPALRAAVRGAGLHGVVLAPAYQKTPLNQVASVVLWKWPELLQFHELMRPPSVTELSMNRATRLRSLPL